MKITTQTKNREINIEIVFAVLLILLPTRRRPTTRLSLRCELPTIHSLFHIVGSHNAQLRCQHAALGRYQRLLLLGDAPRAAGPIAMSLPVIARLKIWNAVSGWYAGTSWPLVDARGALR
jgi:hypothetical protein